MNPDHEICQCRPNTIPASHTHHDLQELPRADCPANSSSHKQQSCAPHICVLEQPTGTSCLSTNGVSDKPETQRQARSDFDICCSTVHSRHSAQARSNNVVVGSSSRRSCEAKAQRSTCWSAPAWHQLHEEQAGSDCVRGSRISRLAVDSTRQEG